MAISFVREQKKQKYLIAVFTIVVLAIVIVVYQNFFKSPADIVIPAAPKEPLAGKAEINFSALENPVLSQLQPFEEIKLTQEAENSAGRKNPFLPY